MAIPISRSSNSNSNIDDSTKKAEARKQERQALTAATDKKVQQVQFASHERAQAIGQKRLEQAMQEAEGFGFDVVRVKAENGEVVAFRMDDLQNWGFHSATPQAAGMEKWGNVPEPRQNYQAQTGAPAANRQAISGPPPGNEDPVGFGKTMESQNSYLFNTITSGTLTDQLFASKRTVRRMNDAMQAKWRLIIAQIMMGDFVSAASSLTMMLEMDSRAAITNSVAGLGKAMRARSNIMGMMARNAPPPPAGSESPQAQATYVRRNSQYMHRQQMYQNALTIANQGIQFQLDGMGDMRKSVQQFRDWAVGFKEAEWRTIQHEANMRT